MTLLDQPPYTVADPRPPAMPRDCSRLDGLPKATYPTRGRARQVLHAIGVGGLHVYSCDRGHIHIGHRREGE